MITHFSMLADAQPSPEAFTQFWLVLVVIASFLANVVMIVTSIIMVTSNKKQRREVTLGFEPASKLDFERHMEINRIEHEGIHRKIGGVERGAQAKLEAAIESGNVSREKLHGRINVCAESMSGLRGSIDSLTTLIKSKL